MDELGSRHFTVNGVTKSGKLVSPPGPVAVSTDDATKSTATCNADGTGGVWTSVGPDGPVTLHAASGNFTDTATDTVTAVVSGIKITLA